MRRLVRIAVSLLAVFTTYGAYTVVAVPLIDPQATLAPPPDQPIPFTTDEPKPSDRMAVWFPDPLAWERDPRERPKMLRNDRGIMLFRKYESIGDGRIRLDRLSMVFLREDPSLSPEQRDRQAIVLQAPKGAVLKFDRKFNISRGDLGKLRGGTLLDQVVIRSQGKSVGPEDDLRIRTSDVRLSESTIWTDGDVYFEHGPNRGSGRGLRIELLPEDERSTSELGRIKSLKLNQEVQLDLVVQDRTSGGLNSVAGARRQGPSGAAPPLREFSPEMPIVVRQGAPVTVRCVGPFHFDGQKNLATFDQRVVVHREHPTGGAPDTLTCHRLSLEFQPRDKAKGKRTDSPPGAAASDSGPSSKLEIRRMIALGESPQQPAVLNAPGAAFAQGRRIEYDLQTRSVSLVDSKRVIFRQQGNNEIQARELHYHPGPDGRLGRFRAEGQGWLDWAVGDLRRDKSAAPPPAGQTTPAQPPRRFKAKWTRQLHSFPYEGRQVIALAGAAQAEVSGMGKLAAEEIHAWLFERPIPGTETVDEHGNRKQKYDTVPDRMRAKTGVTIQSPQMTGRTDVLEVFVHQPQAAAAGPGATAAAGGWWQSLGDAPARPANMLGHRFVLPFQNSLKGFPVGHGTGSPLPACLAGTEVWEANTAAPHLRRRLAAEGGEKKGKRGGGASLASFPNLASRQASWQGTNPTDISETDRFGSATSHPKTTPATAKLRSDRPRVHAVGYRPPHAAAPAPRVAPASALPGRPAAKAPPQQRFDVAGQRIQVQLVQIGEQAKVSQVDIFKQARVLETQTAKPDERPLLVLGDYVQVTGADRDQAVIKVHGNESKPGHVEGRGLSLTGGVVNLDQGKNQVWIDGPGVMTLVAKRDLEGKPLAQAQPLEIHWQGGMDFDGLRAVFRSTADSVIIARRQHETLETKTLEAVLSRRVDFAQAKQQSAGEQRPQIDRIFCRGGVFVKRREFDPRGPTSYEELKAVDLSIDQLSGAVVANGPGWITRWYLKGDDADADLPGLPSRTAMAPRPVAAPGGGPHVARPNTDEPKLNYLKVKFELALRGNHHQKVMAFSDQVQAVHTPVQNWGDTVNPDRVEQLGERGVVLTCDELQLTQLHGPGEQKWIEAVAVGNTVAEGQTFTAKADQIQYTQAKDQLVLVGSDRTPAKLWRQQAVGAPRSHLAARKIEYWRTANHIKINKGQYGEVLDMPAGNRGRPTAPPRPGKRKR